MKIMNQIMFICMIMTVGSLSAATSFTVDKNIPGYVQGMTGSLDGATATIKDANNNVVFTASPASTDERNGDLIGTYQDTSHKADGPHSFTARLYGTLETNHKPKSYSRYAH